MLIKASELIYPITSIFTLLILPICTLTAIILYQSLASYSGFTWDSQNMTTCPTPYLNFKVSSNKTIITLVFIVACLAWVCVVVMELVVFVGWKKLRSFREEGEEIVKEGVGLPFEPYWTFNKIALLYLLNSFALILLTVYFGHVLAYSIQNYQCTMKYFIQPNVLIALSGFTLFILLLCWLIMLTITSKFHAFSREHKYFSSEKVQALEEEIAINNSQKKIQFKTPRKNNQFSPYESVGEFNTDREKFKKPGNQGQQITEQLIKPQNKENSLAADDIQKKRNQSPVSEFKLKEQQKSFMEEKSQRSILREQKSLPENESLKNRREKKKHFRIFADNLKEAKSLS